VALTAYTGLQTHHCQHLSSTVVLSFFDYRKTITPLSSGIVFASCCARVFPCKSNAAAFTHQLSEDIVATVLVGVYLL